MNTAWTSTPDGTSLVYGTIPAIIDQFRPEYSCPAGEIRLPVGDLKKGLLHLRAEKRKGRFRNLIPEDYVYSVTSNYDELWFQPRGTILLIKKDTKRSVAIALNSDDDGIYSIITAFVIDRTHNHKRRKEVLGWSKK